MAVMNWATVILALLGLVAVAGGGKIEEIQAALEADSDCNHGEQDCAIHALQLQSGLAKTSQSSHAVPCGAQPARVCGGGQFSQCVYDESCEADPGLGGCNAGGFHNCRFCGFSHFAACPATPEETTSLAMPQDFINALQRGLRSTDPELCTDKSYLVNPGLYMRQSSGKRDVKKLRLGNGTKVLASPGDFITGHEAVFNGASNSEIGAFLVPAEGLQNLMNSLCCAQSQDDTPEDIFSRCWCSLVAGVGEPAQWASGDQSHRQVVVLQGDPDSTAAAYPPSPWSEVMRSTWHNLLRNMPSTFDFVFEGSLPKGVTIADFCGPRMAVSRSVRDELGNFRMGCVKKQGGFLQLWEQHSSTFMAYGINCTEGTADSSHLFQIEERCQKCSGADNFDASEFVHVMQKLQAEGTRYPLCEDVATVRSYLLYTYGATSLFYGNGNNPSGPEYLRLPTSFDATKFTGLAKGSYAKARVDELTGRASNLAECGNYVWPSPLTGFKTPVVTKQR
eukprot:TRINITY_DN700_c0_g1_i1.p1 TRINITY_DN700_c0_g1~~TRINITY_DN700_c0_g1_i1.p1  ORF type:complete len:506 (-),score=82.32 TRINITY_DN700_c0_g1_i1:211-1728(-)